MGTSTCTSSFVPENSSAYGALWVLGRLFLEASSRRSGRGFVLVYQHLAPFTPRAWPCTVARQSQEAARPVRPVTLPLRCAGAALEERSTGCHG